MSVDKTKTCRVTGDRVIPTLIEEGLMVQMTDIAFALSDDEKIERIAQLQKEILEIIGYDLSDDEMVDTPRRVAKMYVRDLYTAWNPDNFPKCTSFDNKGDVGTFEDEMVVMRNIKNTSFCAHHTAPYDAVFDVAYVIKDRMVGISKLNRIVDTLTKNLTSQETLGKAIARAIQIITDADDVAVRIEGSHGCARYRGIKCRDSKTVTFAALGRFAEKQADLRKEFYNAVGHTDRQIL